MLIFLFIIDNRVKVSGADKNLLKQSDFREEYKVYYTNPLKRLFNPYFKYEIIKLATGVSTTVNKSGLIVKGSSVDDVFEIRIISNKQTFTRELSFHVNREDSDFDGFFDLVELDSEEDRESFVNWFTSVAKSQFYKMSGNWDQIHRDCAGLITYSYREALKSHDLNWLKNYSDLTEQRDIEKYNYPNIPLVGSSCFNTASGFKPGANASTLLNYNMNYISKDTRDLQKGDVLFYYDEEYEMPYHSMIYLGEPGYVVYHTGPIDEQNSGEVRMVLLDDLLKHPDEKWHPRSNNKKYLGGFRWRILM
jgi:hypothetical protein